MMEISNKILLTGINGQVGHALSQKLHSLGEIVAPTRNQLDLSKPDQIREAIQSIRPKLIINAAAYTAVDKAESEPEFAYAINAIAPGILAEEAEKLGALLIHYSTDYVFDGSKTTPYIESDEPNPLNIYGASKLAGENAICKATPLHLILRTSWVYGNYGRNFLKTILELAVKQNQISIVADQLGTPNSSNSIADTTVKIIQKWENNHNGIYHLSNEGVASWYDFACAILNEYQLHHHSCLPLKANAASITAIMSADYHTAATRPLHTKLSGIKLAQHFGIKLPLWQKDLSSIMKSLRD